MSTMLSDFTCNQKKMRTDSSVSGGECSKYVVTENQSAVSSQQLDLYQELRRVQIMLAQKFNFNDNFIPNFSFQTGLEETPKISGQSSSGQKIYNNCTFVTNNQMKSKTRKIRVISSDTESSQE